MDAAARDRRSIDLAGRLLGSRLDAVRVLTGGEHARTLLATTPAGVLVVVRRFPPGDAAGAREAALAPALRPLGALVPRLLAADTRDDEGSVLVTEYVDGTPFPDVDDDALARELGAALARIHEQPGTGLRRAPGQQPAGPGPTAVAARARFPHLDHGDLVLVHHDLWIGNTLWRDGRLVAVVDWSGARTGPRAVDLAWLRLDLVLQDRAAAADLVVHRYEEHAGHRVAGLREWDLQAAAQAEGVVESWAPNYRGIGLAHLSEERLRHALTRWCGTLLDGSSGSP